MYWVYDVCSRIRFLRCANFDCDGALVDSSTLYLHALQRAFKDNGLNMVAEWPKVARMKASILERQRSMFNLV
jgi:beta-phosphoglucomutase-like phosphatase (HAD superfamily)